MFWINAAGILVALALLVWLWRFIWDYAGSIERNNEHLRKEGWVWRGRGNLWTGPILEPPSCLACGQDLRLIRYTDEFADNITVHGLEAYLCDACGADPVFPAQIKRNELRIMGARMQAGLPARRTPFEQEPAP